MRVCVCVILCECMCVCARACACVRVCVCVRAYVRTDMLKIIFKTKLCTLLSEMGVFLLGVGVAFLACLLVFPSHAPEVNLLLNEKVACAAVSPHLCLLSCTQSAVLPFALAAALGLWGFQ